MSKTLTSHEREQLLFRLLTFVAELKKEQEKSELRKWYEQYKTSPFDTPLR